VRLVFYKVDKHFYVNSDKPFYDVLPYHFWGHLKCCYKYYGIKGLKWCYLSKKWAERKAKKLNSEV
jgi:hypothetical protein